jgi:hypothetical protein
VPHPISVSSVTGTRNGHGTEGNIVLQMLLVVGLAVVADADPARAKAAARQRVADRLGQPGTYAATMERLGYSEREIAQVSDRLVDGIVGYGDAAAIAAKVRIHLDVGADHMVMSTAAELAEGVGQLEQLAPTLAGLTS